MTRLSFVCQYKTERGWFDEFWSYCPIVFYNEFNPRQLTNPLKWRAVLRIIKTKTFEQINLEQGK